MTTDNTIHVNLNVDPSLTQRLQEANEDAPNGKTLPGGVHAGQLAAEMKVLNNIEKQMSQKIPVMDRFFKKIGIEFSLKSLLKQSQIFTSTIGSLFQMFGAMVDVILAPFAKYIVYAITKFAEWIPRIGKFAEMIERNIVSKVVGFFQAVYKWFGDLPEWMGGNPKDEDDNGRGNLQKIIDEAALIAVGVLGTAAVSAKFRWVLKSMWNITGGQVRDVPFTPLGNKFEQGWKGRGAPTVADEVAEQFRVLANSGTGWLKNADEIVGEWNTRLILQTDLSAEELTKLISDIENGRLNLGNLSDDALSEIAKLGDPTSGLPPSIRLAINNAMAEMDNLNLVDPPGGGGIRAKLANLAEEIAAGFGTNGPIWKKLMMGLIGAGAGIGAFFHTTGSGGTNTQAYEAARSAANAQRAATNAAPVQAIPTTGTSAFGTAIDRGSSGMPTQLGKANIAGVASELSNLDIKDIQEAIQYFDNVRGEQGFFQGKGMARLLESRLVRSDPESVTFLKSFLTSYRAGRVGKGTSGWLMTGGKQMWMKALENIRSDVFDIPGIGKNIPASWLGMTETQKAWAVAAKQPGVWKAAGRGARGLAPVIGGGAAFWYAQEMPHDEGSFPEWNELTKDQQKQLTDLYNASQLATLPSMGGFWLGLSADVWQQGLRTEANKITGRPREEGTLLDFFPANSNKDFFALVDDYRHQKGEVPAWDLFSKVMPYGQGHTMGFSVTQLNQAFKELAAIHGWDFGGMSTPNVDKLGQLREEMWTKPGNITQIEIKMPDGLTNYQVWTGSDQDASIMYGLERITDADGGVWVVRKETKPAPPTNTFAGPWGSSGANPSYNRMGSETADFS